MKGYVSEEVEDWRYGTGRLDGQLCVTAVDLTTLMLLWPVKS